MAINPLKALLFTGGGVVAVGGAAYVSGALDPLFAPPPPAQVAAVAPEQEPAADAPAAPGTEARVQAPADTPAPAEPAAPATEPAASTAPAAEPAAPEQPASGQPAAEAAQPAPPTFDVVRVEGGGSVVIAGHAAPKAKVEAVDGETVLGAAEAGPDGAFVIVPDTPLKPGDHQITLRATEADGTAVASAQTAVVSVPEKADGQVLAMVEEPGKPSELMTVPEPDKKPEAPAETAAQTPPAPAPAAAPEAPAAVEEPAVAASEPAEAKPAEPAAPAAAAETVPVEAVAVEAVEIDGGKIFVAGTASPGRTVRAYADEILLGEAKTSPDGHFLVEAARELPVGTYTVRVDVLDADGAKVVARAAVPFEREPGEAIAAVAPVAPPSGEEKPADAAKPAETAAAEPADGVPEAVSPKLEHADSAVIIRRHDTLWRISQRVYGHGTRYSTIYLANRDQIRDPDRIWPGQVFKLPPQSREGEPADLKVLGDQMTTAPAKAE